MWACQWPSSQPLSSPQLSHNDSLWALGITKSHKEQGLDYREAEELSWCPSWSNSLWQGWSCGLVHCPGGNATDPIWRVLASSLGISSWTPLKPQHSNPNPSPLAYQFWCIDLLLPHLSLSLIDSLPSLNLLCHSKTDAQFMQDGWKAVWSIPYVSVAFFPSLKQNFIAYCSSKGYSHPDCILKFHQQWQSGFSRVYSNCCCSCSFEPEIINIGQSSHKMYSNKILKFQVSTIILNACTKKVWKLIEGTTYTLNSCNICMKTFKEITLHQDDARLHSVRIMQEKILDLGWSVLLHPPYSADLVPNEFHHFHSLQNAWNDKKKCSQKKVKTFVKSNLSTKQAEFFLRGINKLSD